MESKNIKKRTTFSVACYLKKSSVLKNGEVPIYMRITVNKQAVILGMQGSILTSLWNQAKERSNGKDRTALELNHYIESVKSRLYAINTQRYANLFNQKKMLKKKKRRNKNPLILS